MTKVTLTFEVDEDIRAILADAAKVTGRDVGQLLRDLAEDYAHHQQALIDEPDWLAQEINQGLREADASNAVWISQEGAKADIHRQRQELLRLIADQEHDR